MVDFLSPSLYGVGMTTQDGPRVVPGKLESTDAFLTDHQLFLLGKAIHRIARFEQFIIDWTTSLIIAAGEKPPKGSKAQVLVALKDALSAAPPEFKEFDVEGFLDEAQKFLNYRHFLAHGIAVIDSEGDLCLRKLRPVGVVRKDPEQRQSELLVITDESLATMIETAINLDIFVTTQRQLFKQPHERAKLIMVNPIDGRIMIATEVTHGVVAKG